MKQLRIGIATLLLCLGLVACAPGHTGTTVISFLRDGQLWTIDPDGANAFETVAPQTSIVSDAWSPDHHLLTFRTLDADFAKTDLGKHIVSQSPSGVIGDLPSTLSTVGVDGGSPIEIAFSSPQVAYNTPQWNNNGSRLIYRQTPKAFEASPDNAQWWIAQNDQPGGIAAKPFSDSYSIPSISYNAQNYLIAASGPSGSFTTGMEGTNRVSRSTSVLKQPLSASLERLLWRPAHQNQSFLYVQALSSNFTSQIPLPIRLVLSTLSGQLTVLATCTCTQFAWSPDGNQLLYSTGTTDTILNLEKLTSFNFTVAADAVPYWSPDSQFLLLDSSHTLSLVSLATQKQTLLLTDNTTQAPQQVSLPLINALLQPVPNSLWSADSRHFVFLSQQRLSWQGKKLASGNGLYTAEINNQGQSQGLPVSIASGKISQPGWTYQDPNTSFLY